jgi:hypothetical protein
MIRKVFNILEGNRVLVLFRYFYLTILGTSTIYRSLDFQTTFCRGESPLAGYCKRTRNGMAAYLMQATAST